MKKWFKFFSLSFFSHKTAKEGTRRGYSNVFLGFILALIFLWMGCVGGDMLPFDSHYNNSPDFKTVVRLVFANPDINKRIDAEIEKGGLKLRKHGEQYDEALLVNTFENDADARSYSVNGYNVIVDSRPAEMLAEVDAYCVSNDGKNTVISYQEYLTLSDVARLNFDFKLRYTGNALELDKDKVESYKAYVDGLSDEDKAAGEKLAKDLSDGAITEDEYNKGIYELYFINYYPEITEYESTSKVPLLRNYYYHQYISKGITNYLFIFDDYLTGSFKTKTGIDVSFHGFYSDLENGVLIDNEATQGEANESADGFIKDSFKAIGILNAYGYAVNIISLVPFIVLMLLVAALLTYSILKLRGTESIASYGAMLKIVGSFTWFSGIISAVLAVIFSFFVSRSIITVLPLLLFFVILVIRSIAFAIKESKLYIELSEQQGEV